MPDVSGIDFFHSLSRKPLLIFTTAYSEHAVTSFEMDAVDYLMKPFSLARFLKGCNKAYELFNYGNAASGSDHIFLKTGYDQVKVMFDDILYLEASGNYVTFVSRNRKILSRCIFSEAVNLVPAERFIRVHRSYLLSKTEIEKVERHQVTVSGYKIPSK